MVLGRFFGISLVACALAVALPCAHAQTELFAPTEAPIWRFPFSQNANKQPKLSESALTPLFATEPAAGHEKEELKPEESGKPHESASGKKLSGPPPIPQITITGKPVLTQNQMLAEETSASTPDVLKKPFYADLLTMRTKVNAYAHSPRTGDSKAPITIYQFLDLSCTPCLKEMPKIDEALKPYVSQTLVIHVYAPAATDQTTNLAAFYGKVAERNNLFWAYRNAMVSNPPTDTNAMLATLMATGISETTARTQLLSEARRFYRELDADALVSKSQGIAKPPIVFVNGIRVGDQGIPLENLGDVLKYVQTRLTHHLPEPPQ